MRHGGSAAESLKQNGFLTLRFSRRRVFDIMMKMLVSGSRYEFGIVVLVVTAVWAVWAAIKEEDADER